MNTPIPDCLQNGFEVTLPTNTKVFEAGNSCDHFYYLLSGTIRVELVTWTGKPLTLYRFGAGETCILTTACLLSTSPYNAEAIVEAPVRAIALPVRQFQDLLDTSADFRNLVFTSFASRLTAMMAKIEGVSTVPIEQRLAVRLLELGGDLQPVKITHDQIAADLGTAREVVSRKLAIWEEKGWIQRGRGSFTIVNKDGLHHLARAFDEPFVT